MTCQIDERLAKAAKRQREWMAVPTNRAAHNARVRVRRQDPEYRAQHLSARRERELPKTYGITVAEYESLLLSQAGVCALCERPCASNRRLAVDHDHDTGRVRGLLCISCNQALGKLGDSAEAIARVIHYLEAHASV